MACITKLFVTDNTVPYRNLATEEYLLNSINDDEVILYLWQNKNTVVIGKNQNIYRECRVNELISDGGYPVRRLSGGGAVFHDLGNLNFTFIACEKNYNVEKQLDVIIKAVELLGLKAYKSGRNDIMVSEKKFSGNAFYARGIRKYHHGTILIHADMGRLSLYLNVPEDKLKAKGVTSVRSRVCNLTEFNQDMTVHSVKEALKRAFNFVYGREAETITLSEKDNDGIDILEKKFSSEDWIFGRQFIADYTINKRFRWGSAEIQFEITGNEISDCAVYSDALEVEFTEVIRDCLKNSKFDKIELIKRIENENRLDIGKKSDIIELLKEQIL